MYRLFKIADEIAASDSRSFTSIKELTKQIALSGGYRRGPVQLKNGKTVIRTQYGQRDPKTNQLVVNWDEGLVAKWLVYYKQVFISKISAHPEMKDYQLFIISRTFSILFNALNFDKLTSDAGCVAVFNLCLCNRIGETLYFMPSDERIKEYNENKKLRAKNKVSTEKVKVDKNRVNLKEMLNNGIKSLDRHIEDTGFEPAQKSDIRLDLLYIDIQNKLKDNEIGLKLFEALLYSDTPVKPSSIRNYIKMSPNLSLVEKTTYINQLKDAWKIILTTLRDSLPNDVQSKYDWDKVPSFKLDNDSATKKLERAGFTENFELCC